MMLVGRYGPLDAGAILQWNHLNQRSRDSYYKVPNSAEREGAGITRAQGRYTKGNDKEARRLRKQGWSVRAIASELGLSVGTVYNYTSGALKR